MTRSAPPEHLLVACTICQPNGPCDNYEHWRTAMALRQLHHPTPPPNPTSEKAPTAAPTACCQCTSSSTCKTQKCACRRAKRHCLKDGCGKKCSNQPTTAPSPPPSAPTLCITIDDNEVPEPEILTPHSSASGTSTTTSGSSVDGNVETAEEADLPGYVVDEMDEKLISVYGDFVHKNGGFHLHGGIDDDEQWQKFWKLVTGLPPQSYDVPKGSVGRAFVDAYTKLLRGALERKWNSERLVVFCSVVLQRERGISGAKAIRQRISQRMDLWEKGHWEALVEDTVRTNLRLRANSTENTDEETVRRVYCRLLLQGKVREAVRFLSGRIKGGVLQPNDIDTKSGLPVIDVLMEKHPSPGNATTTALLEYETTPPMLPLVCTADLVAEVAKRMGGSGGPGGVDSYALADWILRFGESSRRLRSAISDFTMWLSNESPPWAAYRALCAGRIVALDKCPGVRPVGVGETLFRMMAKLVLKLTGEEATAACGVHQLCAGLEAGIEGGGYTLCVPSGMKWVHKRIGVPYWLMPGTPLTRCSGGRCCGMLDMHGHLARDLHSMFIAIKGY